MASKSKPFYENGFYHIYNRGNQKQDIFVETRDYNRFLERVQELLEKLTINLLAYILMPNHFHFLVQELVLGNTTKFMHRLSTSHSKYFNAKYETVGSLLQRPFKVKEIKTEEQLMHVSRYIHLNTLELFGTTESKVPNAQDDRAKEGTRIEFMRYYLWSSYPDYIGTRAGGIVNKDLILDYFGMRVWRKGRKVKITREVAYRDYVESYIDHPDRSIKDLVIEVR